MFEDRSCAFLIALIGISNAVGRVPAFAISAELHVKSYSGNCNPPNDQKTKACLDAYFKTYGFDTSKRPPPFYEYQQKHTSVISQYGNSGLDVSCEFEATLETCLGPLMHSACMNAATLQRIYNTGRDHDMVNYAISFADCEYECHNKDLTKSAMACVEKIGHAEIQNMNNNCTTRAQMAHENGVNYCEVADDEIICMEDAYVQYCGEELREYVCTTENIFAHFTVYDECRKTHKFHQC